MSKSNSIPYERCVGGDQALNEAARILAKFGCQSFGHMIDAERGCTIVQFKFQGHQVSLEASWKGYAAAYLKVHPCDPLPAIAEKLAAELRRARCRIVHAPGQPSEAGETCKRCEALAEYDAFVAIVQVPKT